MCRSAIALFMYASTQCGRAAIARLWHLRASSVRPSVSRTMPLLFHAYGFPGSSSRAASYDRSAAERLRARRASLPFRRCAAAFAGPLRKENVFFLSREPAAMRGGDEPSMLLKRIVSKTRTGNDPCADERLALVDVVLGSAVESDGGLAGDGFPTACGG